MRRYSIYLHLLVMLTVLISGLANAWQNVATQAQVSHFKNERLDLICTGDELRWIDPIASIEQGQFIFVDAPQDAPPQLQHPDCGLTHLADHAATTTADVTLAHAVLHDATVIPLAPRASLTQRYLQPPPRAPPRSV